MNVLSAGLVEQPSTRSHVRDPPLVAPVCVS
jgi:hypothetical protein